MNEAQRTVLQKHHVELAQDIVVTDRILGVCYQTKLFDNHLIDIIKAESTPTQQIYRFLDLLPRRGPDAFDTFVNIIKSDYPWLATKLTASLQQEVARYSNSIPQGLLPRIDSQNDLATGPSPRRVPSPRNSLMVSHSQSDSILYKDDIRQSVNGFMQRQLSVNMKLSSSEKRAVEKFLTHQVKTERQLRTQSAEFSDFDEPDGCTGIASQPDFVKEWLLQTFKKVKSQYEAIVPKPKRKNNQGFYISDDEDEEEEKPTHDSINFEIIETQIDKVLKQVQKSETELKKCHNMVDDPERKLPLRVHVDKMVKEKQKNKEELENEKRETEKVKQEMNCLVMEKKKLEHEIKLKDVVLDVKTNEINTLKRENTELQKDVERLQKAQLIHAEKQNTLINLREMITDMQKSQETIQSENVDLKEKLKSTEEKVEPTPPSSASSKKTSKNSLTKSYSKGQGSRLVQKKKPIV